MCLGCGRRAPKHDLMRFTAIPRGGALVVVADHAGAHGGRGLYTCHSRACVQRAIERRAFARGARAQVEVDDALLDDVDEESGLRG